MSVVCKEQDADTYCVFLKGATESVLGQCTRIQLGKNEMNFDHEKFKPELYDRLEIFASKGLVGTMSLFFFWISIFRLDIENLSLTL